MRTSTRLHTLLEAKGHQVTSVPPESSVFLAVATMSQYETGSVLVVDERGQLLGIVTERDYTRKVLLQNRTSRTAAVTEIMTPAVNVTPDTTVEEAMRLMTERRVRHLPVVDAAGAVTGLLSIGDLVKWVISEQEGQIQQLEQLIAGTYRG
ncbi:MAG: CBS domain-containing protein [Acidobacteria bacterium]|nr:CBS domain-containing protein [Acidobacteriota bacterium]